MGGAVAFLGDHSIRMRCDTHGHVMRSVGAGAQAKGRTPAMGKTAYFRSERESGFSLPPHHFAAGRCARRRHRPQRASVIRPSRPWPDGAGCSCGTALRAFTWLRCKPRNPARLRRRRLAPQKHHRHSTVTLLARFLGLSTSVPRATAVWYASSCSGTTWSKGLNGP